MVDRWLTTREVAVKMSISTTAVVRLCQRGTLAHAWHGDRYMIRLSAVVSLLDCSDFQKRRRHAS